ncbi:MAG TPA: hypothetical protein VEW48_00360 [Thermoanaerobaculia bacterium]|nr:hypothetical protein [Thermoanaerobaculia bacterium]
MWHSLLRAPVALLTAVVILWVPLSLEAQQPLVCQTTPATQTDNRDGYFVNLEEGPVVPLALLSDRKEVWAVNVSDASLTVFSAANPYSLVPRATIKVALGPVSVVVRPPLTGPGEVWVVCQSSNAVVIVDRASRRILDSIRLTQEPSGLVFNAAGTKAWVSLAASNQVVEIDATTRAVAATLPFSTPFPDPTSPLVHVEEPRSLLLDGSDLYALSFEGGNGTFGLTGGIFDDTILNLWQFYNPTGTPPIPPPPDRDVLRFTVPGANPASVALWRTGSINFDLEKDNAGELWVSNVDYNNTSVGEFQFPGGGIARHRITHAPPLAPGAPAPTTPPASIDLNTAVLPALASQGYACALPNQMAFSSSFSTLYVACNDTHNVAVLDVASQQVIAELRGLTNPAMGLHQNFGVRGVLLWETAGALYTYSRDHRLQVYQVPVASGTVSTPVQTLAIGFDIAQPLVREGRFQHMNALRSQSKLQSCNTCHIDGHLDRIAWNLSDFTGDLPANPVPRVAKGAKVTMSLRGIEETPPFHWRGDRGDLSAFNPAFVGLLGGTQLTAAELAAFEAFVFSLSYPPNPKQPLDRTYSSLAVQGANAFRCVSAHNVRFDNNPAGPLIQGISCQFCHGMAGSSATNDQVNNDINGLLADDATQLRGLFDKESDTVDYATGYGFPPPNDKLPATGWGFGNTGSFADTVTDFVNLGVFQAGQLTQTDRDNIVHFLDEFDSGLAPATAYAWTLNRTSAGTTNQPFNTLLQNQANLGNIDLVIRGWMFVGTVARNIGMLYNPQSGLFDTDTTGVGPFSYAQLVLTASQGKGVFLLLGAPVKSGYRLGRDQEMDFALDGDEAAAGAVVGVADTDNDRFPDGYEMRLGSNPGSATSLPPADTAAPVFTVAPQVAWTNSKVAKVRWQTGEEATSRIEVQPAGSESNPPLVIREDLQFKKDHVLVVRGLQPGQSYDFYVKSTDPALPGNTATQTLANVTMQGFDFQSAHLAQTGLTAASTSCGNPVALTATFQVDDETGAAVNGATVTFTKVEWTPGGGNQVTPNLTAGPTAGGVATASMSSTLTACTSGAKVEVFVTAVTGVNRLYFHPLDGASGFWAQVTLP